MPHRVHFIDGIYREGMCVTRHNHFAMTAAVTVRRADVLEMVMYLFVDYCAGFASALE